jgi:molybdenum cofactor synthesis domain-containing protein
MPSKENIVKRLNFCMWTEQSVRWIDMGVVPDAPEQLERAFATAAKSADVVITSGGVSVGEADYVKQLLDKLGEVLFWKIAMRPGRPMAFGRIGKAFLFGLPGNPVAVMVTFYQFVREALLILQGQTDVAPLPSFKVPLAAPIRKAMGRTEFQRRLVRSREIVPCGEAGGKAEVPARLIERLTQSDEPNPDFPVFTSAPLYLRESLIFPYNAGARFQDAVYRKLGKQAFEAVFQRPPRSTQQIMHPEAYLNDKKPAATDPPALETAIGKDGREFRSIIEGVVGEFDIAMLLRQYVGDPEGAAAAAHWHGGAFRLYEHKKEKYPVLVYVSDWDTPEAARAYFSLHQRVLKGKWKNMEVASQTDSEVRGTGDSGRFVLRIFGASVQSIEGLR